MKLRGFLDELRRALLGNFAYKGVALAFALMAWIWVQSEQVVEERAKVRLDWKLPEGLVPVEPPLETATLTVEGVQAFVRSVRQKELSIALDLSRAKDGDVNVDLTERPITGLPPQVRVTSISPTQLKVRLDRVQKRRVRVVPATDGVVADGFRLVGVAVKPDRVELVGPSSVLRAMDEVATDVIDVSGLREDVEFDVGLAVKKGQLTVSGAGTVAVSVDVEPAVDVRTFERVPVMVRDANYATDVGEVTVKIRGPLEQIGEIDPEEVNVLVHVPEGFAAPSGEARPGDEGLRYQVVHPGGDKVEVIEVKPATIPVVRK
ncbi:MAG: CdaR family protein [Myxococcota bacterium]